MHSFPKIYAKTIELKKDSFRSNSQDRHKRLGLEKIHSRLYLLDLEYFV
jgi:hypothetical protein